MKNAAGSIIYVGKSKCLKNRVSSYFQAPERLNVKTRKLVGNIADFETIVTGSEAEALLLENELIKRHMPKYNIKLNPIRISKLPTKRFRGSSHNMSEKMIAANTLGRTPPPSVQKISSKPSRKSSVFRCANESLLTEKPSDVRA